MCDDSFEVVVHHGGYFEMKETLNYSNGGNEHVVL